MHHYTGNWLRETLLLLALTDVTRLNFFEVALTSERRFHLIMLVRGKRYEVARAGLVH